MKNQVRRQSMRVFKTCFCFLSFLVLLAGCDQQALFEKFIPKEESAIAKKVFAQLAAKDFAAVEKQLDASIRNPDALGTLEQVAGLFPAEEVKSIKTVGSYTSVFNDVTTYNLTFEYEFSNQWLINDIVLQRRGDQLTVTGLHVNPMKQSLKELNRFTFKGKGFLHYAVFALAIAIPLFCICVLVLCFRTPIAKRKWLWMLFVALGFVQFSLNWSDGSYGFQPISFLLLGGGFVAAGPYAPFVFNIAFPLGAIVFLFKRRSLIKASLAASAPSVESDSVPPQSVS